MATPAPDQSVRPRRRGLRIAGIIAAVFVLLVVAGVTTLLVTFDPNSLKPRIVAAVKQATGRDLTLNGPIGLKWSLRPTLAVHDAAFANPPGFSRPQMATLQELDLQLALFPLLHKQVEIERLVLLHPDIRLETNAQERPNWQFGPEVGPNQPAAGASNQPATGGSRMTFGFREVRITDGTLAYHDGRTGRTTTLGMHSLTARTAEPDAALHLEAEATYNATPVTLVADTGPLSRLQDPAATTPWPVKAALAAAGARLTGDGALTQPMQGKGYTMAVNATVPDLAALAPFVPGVRLPPLHEVTFAANVADSGQTMPAVTGVVLHAGTSDLGSLRPGLRLDRLDVTAPATDQPMRATVAAAMGATPLTAVATLPAPVRLLPGATGAVPVDITAQAAGARLTMQGSIAEPEALRGVALDLAASIPDLATLSPLAGRGLPAVTGITFRGRMTDLRAGPAQPNPGQGGITKGAVLSGMVLTSSVGDLKGDVAVGFGVPFSVTAKLASDRIDLDAWSAAQGKPLPDAGGKPAPQAAASAPAPGGRLFSDQPIPFGLLKLVDADIAATIADLHAGGRDTRAIQTHVALRDGRLTVDPFMADLPTGHLDAKLSVDATQQVPPVGIVLHAPGLALRTLLAMAGKPDLASGNLEVDASLRGVGDSPHAIAASLDGTLGLALANGAIENKALAAYVVPLLEKANVPNVLDRGGVSEIRCFGAKVDFAHGTGTFRTLALSSTLLTIDGGGTVNLGEETLALHLRPQARIRGNGLVVPLRVTGAIRAPAVALDPIGAAEANAGTIAGAVIGGATPLGALGGVLGAGKAQGNGGDACAGPLAVARGQPAPANAPAAAAAPPGAKPPNPAGLLRQLFR